MSDEATEQITLDELIQLGIDAAQQSLHTADVAIVVSYDRSVGTVEVSFPVGRMLPDGSGNFVLEAAQNMKDIPVCFPRCQAFALTFPLVAGDSGLVVFAMRNIGAWRTTAAAGSPGDVGMHTPDGAVFIPGVLPDKHAPQAAKASDMEAGSETDAKGRIVFKPAALQLGDGATEAVLKGNSVASATGTLSSALQTLNTAIGAFASAVGVATPAVSGAAVTLNTAITAAATAISNYSTAITNAKSTSTTVL